jgi:hypothetical protein
MVSVLVMAPLGRYDYSPEEIVITMIRTQISLTEAEYAAAKLEAERLGISLAELLRRSLRGIVPPGDQPAWMRFAGMVSSGNPESSQQVDDIVYGRKD